jgi:aminoglycoside phosphotransferase (APT) family kinase protein
MSSRSVYVPGFDDADLDAWLADFDAAHAHHQPLHGDFYAGNMLVADQRIVAVLDWDEARLGPSQREVAWAAWEWGNGLDALDLRGPFAFIADYEQADGPGVGVDEEALRQLVRQRLRWEAQYREAIKRVRGPHRDDDAYAEQQKQAFSKLRP